MEGFVSKLGPSSEEFEQRIFRPTLRFMGFGFGRRFSIVQAFRLDHQFG